MKLPSNQQIERVIKLLRDQGVQIGRVDILSSGVSVYPLGDVGGSAYDDWKNESNDRTAHG